MSRNDSIILSLSYDTELLTLREAFLRTQGCEVRSVMSVHDAVVLTSTRRFDAVIVGHSVPADHQRQLVSAIKQRWPRLPVLAIVVDPDERDKIADATVAGSAGPDALMEALRRVIREHPVKGTVSDQDQHSPPS